MTPAVTQLEDLHARLGCALANPRSVGMPSDSLPLPLDELLRATHSALAQLLVEVAEEGSANGLEAELSQDADRE